MFTEIMDYCKHNNGNKIIFSGVTKCQIIYSDVRVRVTYVKLVTILATDKQGENVMNVSQFNGVIVTNLQLKINNIL
jgi:hypothetical protein